MTPLLRNSAVGVVFSRSVGGFPKAAALLSFHAMAIDPCPKEI